MIPTLITAGVCLIIPSLILYLVARFTPDLPARPVVPGTFSPWRPDAVVAAQPPTKDNQDPSAVREIKTEATAEARSRLPEPEVRGQEMVQGPAEMPFLKRDYNRLVNFLYLLWPLFIVACTAGWASVFFALRRWRMAEAGPAVFLVVPEAGWWFLPAGFLGLGSSCLVVSLVPRVLLGRRYADYSEWIRGRQGLERQVNVRGLLLFFWLLIVLPVTLFATLGMDCYSRFSEEGIGINRFWGFGERTYSYSQVRHVVRTTHVRALTGAVSEAPRLYIAFDDGRSWCNALTGRSGPPFEKEALKIIQFVCRKTGKKLKTVRFIEDVMK